MINIVVSLALTGLAYWSSIYLVSLVLCFYACAFLWPVTYHIVKEERTHDGILKTPDALLFISWVCRILQIVVYIVVVSHIIEVFQ